MISCPYTPNGLANQMFQYAAAYSHSLRMGTTLFFPEKHAGHDGRSPNLHNIFKLSADRTGEYGPEYHQPGFHYTPLPLADHMTLVGYFQSEKFFKDYEDTIRKEFTFKEQCKPPKPKTVSIHIPRSDYLLHPNHHPLCSLDYYERAMAEFKDYNFLVFSDDKQWCLDNFKYENVEISLEESNFLELQQMSQCDHHIISNSSFSWWAAWLNTNPDKRVIAPKTWFGPAYDHWDTSDLYPSGWRIL